MIKKITLFFLLLSSPIWCQVGFYANSNFVQFKAGVIVKVNGTFTNNANVINEGTLITQNFVNNLGKSFFNDSLLVSGNFTNNSTNFSGVGTLSNTIILNGEAPAKQIVSRHLSKNINNLVLQGSAKKYLLTSMRISRQFFLQNGTLAITKLTSDTLFVDSTASVVGGNLNSFVIGRLYRKRNLTNDSLFFPIGDTTILSSLSTNRYRPATLSGINTVPSGKKYPVYFARTLDSMVTYNFDNIGIRKINNNRRWHVRSSDTTITVNNIKLSFSGLEDFGSTTTGDTLVVAQANSIWGKFESIGNSKFGSNFVTSEFRPSKNYYSLASAYNLKLAAKIFLEGPLASSTSMNITNPILLKNTYEFGKSAKLTMLQGYNVPNGAVDVVTIYLSASNKLDSVNAWLMADGSIKDFSSGLNNYINFSNSLPGSYKVLVAHRNHLPIQFVNPVSMSNTIVNLDFTTNTNIFGGGVINKFGKAAMYAGDAYTDRSQAEINAADLFMVSKLSKNPIYNTGFSYQKADLNLDGKVDAIDYDIVADHNNKLYYSTIKP